MVKFYDTDTKELQIFRGSIFDEKDAKFSPAYLNSNRFLFLSIDKNFSYKVFFSSSNELFQAEV
jgi:hypothetical protein